MSLAHSLTAAVFILVSAGAYAGAAPSPGLDVRVDAGKGVSYFAKCHVRTFRGPDGVFANTYVIDSKGAFHDVIPSPNAQCVFSKVKGDGPVVLHIAKGGDHMARVDAPGKWVRLNVW
jgi:hypothetical protein